MRNDIVIIFDIVCVKIVLGYFFNIFCLYLYIGIIWDIGIFLKEKKKNLESFIY